MQTANMKVKEGFPKKGSQGRGEGGVPRQRELLSRRPGMPVLWGGGCLSLLGRQPQRMCSPAGSSDICAS